jgi:hypothetical protein
MVALFLAGGGGVWGSGGSWTTAFGAAALTNLQLGWRMGVCE